MKKSILIAGIAGSIFYGEISAQSPIFQYAKSMGGKDYDRGSGIAVDGSGNSYIIGTFGGTVDFDPGAGIVNLVSAGESDLFFAKYNATGNLVFAKKIGGMEGEYPGGIIADTSGSCYIIGSFKGTANFGSAKVPFSLTSNGNYDIFIAGYSKTGMLNFAKKLGGIGEDYGNCIVFDSSKNFYTTGSFTETVDFDPGVGVMDLTSKGGSDIFVAKYNSLGEILSAKSMGGDMDDKGESIVPDRSGNIYLTGNFRGTVDFGSGAAKHSLTYSGIEDIFIVKYAASGDLIFAKNISNNQTYYSSKIAVDDSGNSYVIANFEGTAYFDRGMSKFVSDAEYSSDADSKRITTTTNSLYGVEIKKKDADSNRMTTTTNPVEPEPIAYLSSSGSSDMLIAKYDPAGKLIFAKNIGSDIADAVNEIVVDGTGNFYITGYTYKGVDFDPGDGTLILNEDGKSDAFVARYDSACNLISAKSFEANAIYGIAIDVSENIYLTGNVQYSANLNLIAGKIKLTSKGSWDIFIAKYNRRIYKGIVINGKANGQGIMTYSNGDNATGEFKDDLLQGQGTMIFANGNKYTGSFKDDKMDGQGIATYQNGDKYEGEFKDDKMNGKGIFTYQNANKYEGELKDNKFRGQGALTFANGDKYTGEWKDDNRNGKGTYTWTDGRKYTGEWKDNNRNGKGTYTWTDGDKYVEYTGEWKDDYINGQGTLIFVNGDKYAGAFRDNDMNGQGTMTFANGKTQNGIFKDGECISIGTLVTSEAIINGITLQAPEQDDYLLSRPVNATRGNLMFKKSRMVYYDYDFEKKDKPSPSPKSKTQIKELFENAEKLNFPNLLSMDEKKLSTSAATYRIVEYKKDGKIYRICWDTAATDAATKQLNAFIGSMDSFW